MSTRNTINTSSSSIRTESSINMLSPHPSEVKMANSQSNLCDSLYGQSNIKNGSNILPFQLYNSNHVLHESTENGEHCTAKTQSLYPYQPIFPLPINTENIDPLIFLNNMSKSILPNPQTQRIQYQPKNINVNKTEYLLTTTSINTANDVLSPSLTASSPEYFDLDILQNLDEEFAEYTRTNTAPLDHFSQSEMEQPKQPNNFAQQQSNSESIQLPLLTPPVTIPTTLPTIPLTTWDCTMKTIEYGSRKDMEIEKFENNNNDTFTSSLISKKTTSILNYGHLVLNNCTHKELNGLYYSFGFRNGVKKYIQSNNNKYIIYCNPKRGWIISNNNCVYYTSFPVTKQPPTEIDCKENKDLKWINNQTENELNLPQIKSYREFGGYNIMDLLFIGFLRDEVDDKIKYNKYKLKYKFSVYFHKNVAIDIVDIFCSYFEELVNDKCENCLRECENVVLCGYKWLCKECNVEAMF